MASGKYSFYTKISLIPIMPHILAHLTSVDFDLVKKTLQEHAPMHAKQGLHLEHVWRNADKKDDVYFLFRVDDLGEAKKFVQKTHAEARKNDPNAKLPAMIFLK
jgi:hypothetical protein